MWPNNPLEPPEAPGDTHPVEHIGGRTSHGWVDTVIFQTDGGDYYFSCATCGNSGQHWHGKDYAIVQAVYHIQFYDHTPYLMEASDEHRESSPE